MPTPPPAGTRAHRRPERAARPAPSRTSACGPRLRGSPGCNFAEISTQVLAGVRPEAVHDLGPLGGLLAAAWDPAHGARPTAAAFLHWCIAGGPGATASSP
ncbi:hypothetical protein H696_03239 [Fonticula alba]|uniref:Uncharacterized protein n=1 Tax=Fonticula alba TaxID=691883 RepID=A0A058Z673_FONAL|nr:hypothetical protein H696_03239 [Fonticula alba]KCV69794.1 hypothetical protein H696_03239 [Fonticula alba]|eukprot:XP_009495400.1 hypothetical protein H696_03239 [Fonticula alba]